MTERRLSPLTMLAALASTALWVVAIAVPAAVLLGVLVTPWAALWVAAGAALVLGCGALAGWLSWRFTSYEVADDRFVLRGGILVRRTRTFARERIRAVDVTAGPVQRLFGLASVHIGTAEQTGEDGSAVLSPLPRADAEWLQAELLPRGSETVGTLARFSPAWMLYAPLSWTPLAIMGGVYAVAGQFADGLGEIGWRWATDTANSAGWWVVAGVVVGIPLLVGVVGSFVVHAELWWNLRLERGGGVLRVRRGLLTTRSVSLPENRLRGARVVEALGPRLAGAAQLEALAIGLQNQNPQDESSRRTQSNVLLPYAPRAVVDAVTAAVLTADRPPTDPAMLIPHPPAAFARRLVGVGWAVAGWLIGTGILAATVVPRWWWVVLIGAVVLGVAGAGWAHDAWRGLGHRLDDRHLVARSGSLERTTDALERGAIIGWNVRQSFFQRRRGLITVVATTGAGKGACRVLDLDAGDGIALADAATPGLLSPFLAGRPAGLGRVDSVQ